MKNIIIDVLTHIQKKELLLPFISENISAGFPSPAMDFTDASIDLNAHLIKNPSSSFLGRVCGSSMKDKGIDDGDMIIIDKSLPAKTGKIAVCFIDGAFTIKTIQIKQDCCWLLPANTNYPAIKIDANTNEFIVWGIVTHVIKYF